MKGAPDGAGVRARRIAIVVVVYGSCAALAWFLVPWVQRTFLLPPLFVRLAHGALILGVPMAAAVAWGYGSVGEGGASGGSGEGP